PHRVAIVKELLACSSGELFGNGFRGLVIEAHVFAGLDGHEIPAVRSFLRLFGVRRLAVGVPVIDDRSGGGRLWLSSDECGNSRRHPAGKLELRAAKTKAGDEDRS